jgi:hypothetical protein
MIYKQINDWQIETPDGFSDFIGIHCTAVDVLFTISFTDGTSTKCTDNHLFKFPTGEFLEASNIIIGDELCGGKVVSDISYEDGVFTVYGITDVELNGEYISDGIVSHNCAFIEDIDEIWTSAQSTLSTGGSCIALSTPNGVGNWFHRTWVQSEEGNQLFNPIKLHWTVHPERDQKWRDDQEVLLGHKKAAQECDADFVSSGDTVIDPELLMFYKETYVIPPIEKGGIDGNLWKWEYPDFNKTYMVVADVARGDGADYSACHVLDVSNSAQVAEYRGKMDTKDFGNFLVSLATEYNDALLVIENANIGWATIQQVIDRNYKNLFYMSKDLKYVDTSTQMTNKYRSEDRGLVAGFSTTSKSRPLIISKLEDYFKEKSITVRSQRLIDELFTFIWLGGRAEAMRGYNDDLVMSLSIGLWVRDTALRLRQEGIDLTKATISGITSQTYSGIYGGSAVMDNDPWKINVGGEVEDLSKWL